MATVVASSMDVDARPQTGLRAYYDAKIEELEVRLRDKTQNLRRLEAQRNELNGRGARRARASRLRARAVRGARSEGKSDARGAIQTRSRRRANDARGLT